MTSRAASRPVWESTRTRRTVAGRLRVTVVTAPASQTAPPVAVSPARRCGCRPRSTSAGPAAQPQEELDVPRRPRQRAARHRPGAPAQRGGPLGDRGHRLGPQLRVADHAALADPVLADLELRLDHQHQVAVGAGHADQRLQHQRQRDERQVAHHQVDRAADQLGGELADVGAVVHLHPLVGLERPGQLAVAHVHRHHLARARAAAARR